MKCVLKPSGLREKLPIIEKKNLNRIRQKEKREGGGQIGTVKLRHAEEENKGFTKLSIPLSRTMNNNMYMNTKRV